MAFVGQDQLGLCPPRSGFEGTGDALAFIRQLPPDYDNALLAVQQTVSELGRLLVKIDAVSIPDAKARQIKDELQVALISPLAP
ncbi:MAG TPA: hypothetical protein VNP04_27305 [Alphaproteobacteria bacterium]|nr:hypothetical protein [Alphaproteobacteria bacterium]